MIGLLKYGAGLPFNRLEWLERNLGIPLPASTQWEVVRDAADELAPIHEELIRQAAQAEIFHNDDTSAKILSLMAENRALVASGEADAGARTGIFATSIVAILGGERRVALFFTGRKHAGENAEELLEHRAAELGPPIQMCDALDRNVPAKAETLLGNCIPHGRRKFVEIHESFPAECRHVLETLGEVFGHEADAKTAGLSPEQRLQHHRERSAPVMDGLHAWMERQLDDRLVEPNSTLGDALRYMLNHWEPLTLFLRQPGAPPRQQYLRTGAEEVHPPAQELVLLQDRERRRRRRLLHESDPHGRAQPGEPVRLPGRAPAQRRPGGQEPCCLAPVELRQFGPPSLTATRRSTTPGTPA